MNPSFSRTALVLGNAAIDRLQAAHVAVLGLGGVGGYAAEALARAGVGELTLIDEDVIGPTNLNRQLLATVDAIGQPKADAATARAAAINPDCTLHPLRFRYEAAAREEFFAVRYDYIVDAIDLVSCKLDLIETAHARSIPIISALGTGDKLDASAFVITDIAKTQGCHLARVLRKELRNRGVTHHKVVYSPELPHRGEAADHEAPPPGRRAIPGSTPWCPAVAGLLLAQAVVLDLTQTIL